MTTERSTTSNQDFITEAGFVTSDESMVPVELEGSYYHLKCAEAMGIMDQVHEYHGGEHFATYAMDNSLDFEEHEFCCAGCLDLFPFVNTGRWY